ncbi:MAG: CDP-alcohol phosphatidyltransferase family protein [Thermoplasmatales archaeon]|nr:MAG: CDP-alcohol phosphatidyltransferase family protein [Thermoplasmatales archaeon]
MNKKESFIKKIYSEHEGEHFIKKSEPPTIVFIGRIFGTPLARLFAKLKINPNIITLLTVPLSFLAGFFFFYNNLPLGALLYFIGYVLDCADGTLARLTNTTSRLGERLDYYTDILNNIPMYFGLWYSQFYLQGMWLIGGAIIVAHYAIIAFGYIFLKKLTYKTISPKLCSYYMHSDEGFLTFFFAPLTGMFYLMFPILVLIQFLSYIILFFTQKEKPDIKNNIRSMFKL